MPAGPKFIRFFWPLLTALRELGGAAKPREVIDLVLDSLHIPDDERAERTKSGSLRVENQVHWARNYLVWAGLLDGSERGWWKLSKEGWVLPLEEQEHDTAHALFSRSEPNAARSGARGAVPTTTGLTPSNRLRPCPPQSLPMST